VLPRSGCDGRIMTKFLITIIEVNFGVDSKVNCCYWPLSYCKHRGSTKAYLCPHLCSISFSIIVWVMIAQMLWLQCETWVSAVLAGVFLTLFFAWNVTKSIQSSWKQRVVIHHNQATHSLLNSQLEHTLQRSNIPYFP